MMFVTEAFFMGECLSPKMVGDMFRSVGGLSWPSKASFSQIFDFGTPRPEEKSKDNNYK